MRLRWEINVVTRTNNDQITFKSQKSIIIRLNRRAIDPDCLISLTERSGCKFRRRRAVSAERPSAFYVSSRCRHNQIRSIKCACARRRREKLIRVRTRRQSNAYFVIIVVKDQARARDISVIIIGADNIKSATCRKVAVIRRTKRDLSVPSRPLSLSG